MTFLPLSRCSADYLHSIPVAQMGNYQEYLKAMPSPLREIDPDQPKRMHTFGNPFKQDKKVACHGQNSVSHFQRIGRVLPCGTRELSLKILHDDMRTETAHFIQLQIVDFKSFWKNMKDLMIYATYGIVIFRVVFRVIVLILRHI